MKKSINSLLVLFWVFISNNAFAALTIIPSGTWIIATAFRTWEFQIEHIYAYLVYLIELLMAIAAIVAFIFILVWAFRYVLSFWEDEAAQSAKKTIKNSIIGFIVASLSYVIVDILIRFITQ